MADSNEFLSEEENEQYRHLMRDLRLMYRPDGQAVERLARIRQRLLSNDASTHPLSHQTIDIQPDSRKRDAKPARSAMRETKPWQRHVSMVAAILVVAVLVSSLLLVLNQARRSSIGTPAISIGGFKTVRSLHMVNASTGWMLNGNTVLRTDDGAVHWKDVTPAGTTLTQSSIADFPTASVASIATPQADGTSTQVLHTVDGGQTWQRAIIPMPFPRQISFVDAQHGWVLASIRPLGGAAESVSVFRTTNGGKTWVPVASALFADTTPPGRLPYGGQKSGMRFLDSQTGWVTGTVPLSNVAWLYVTHDGGSTWKQQSLPMPSAVPSARLTVLSPTFFSATDGILPVIFSDFTTDKAIATAIYRTHDAGNTWQDTTPVPVALPLLSFADLQHGWATDGTTLYNTSDGGNHWQKLSTGTNFKNIAQLDFLSATVGWATSSTTANSSSLLKTTDGGQTWTPFPSLP